MLLDLDAIVHADLFAQIADQFGHGERLVVVPEVERPIAGNRLTKDNAIGTGSPEEHVVVSLDALNRTVIFQDNGDRSPCTAGHSL